MLAAAILMPLVLAAGSSRGQAQPQPLAQGQQQSQASQAPANQQPPYTLDGVRRATSMSGQADTNEEPDADTPPPSRKLARPSTQQKIEIATWAPEPAPWVPRADDDLITGSLALAGPAWHQEFLGLTTPDLYSPFGNMGNAERLVAVASGTAFALGVEGVTRLVQAISREHSRRKVLGLRREIDAETALVEQRHEAYLAEKQKSDGTDEPAKKKQR